MKTDDLIAMLASGAAPVDRKQLSKRLAAAWLLGLLGATFLAAMVFGLRADLMEAEGANMFRYKCAYAAAMALGAAWMTARLSRPGRQVGVAWFGVAIPLAVLWIGAAALLWQSTPADRLALVWGSTWAGCPFYIAFLSLPVFPVVFWAVKGLAPTRLRAAGAAAGLLSGALATMAYCLHCPEMAPAFWAIWYVLGMLIPAGVGAWLGPRLLRW